MPAYLQDAYLDSDVQYTYSTVYVPNKKERLVSVNRTTWNYSGYDKYNRTFIIIPIPATMIHNCVVMYRHQLFAICKQ